MRALKWLVSALLLWGLFIGISYLVVPAVTSGHGNGTTLVIGIALIVGCAFGLLRLFPRHPRIS
jgi:hypothetical protein